MPDSESGYTSNFAAYPQYHNSESVLAALVRHSECFAATSAANRLPPALSESGKLKRVLGLLAAVSESIGKLKHGVHGMTADSESASVKEVPAALAQFSESQLLSESKLVSEFVLAAVGQLNHVVVGALCTDSESLSVRKMKHALLGAALGADSESRPLGKLKNAVPGLSLVPISESKRIGKLKNALSELKTHSENAAVSAARLLAPVSLVPLSESQTFAANRFAPFSESQLLSEFVGKLMHDVVDTDSESVSVGSMKHVLLGAGVQADSESRLVGKLSNDVTAMNSESVEASVELGQAPVVVVQLSESALFSESKRLSNSESLSESVVAVVVVPQL